MSVYFFKKKKKNTNQVVTCIHPSTFISFTLITQSKPQLVNSKLNPRPYIASHIPHPTPSVIRLPSCLPLPLLPLPLPVVPSLGTLHAKLRVPRLASYIHSTHPPIHPSINQSNNQSIKPYISNFQYSSSAPPPHPHPNPAIQSKQK